MASILVVDDNPSVCLTLTALLEEEGYTVKSALNAEIASDFLAVLAFDVVITDIGMPRTSGIDLLGAVGRSDPDVSVLVMTGLPSIATATQALQGGAFDFLVKPFTAEEIIRAVARAAAVRELKAEKRRLAAENQAYQERLERMVEERTAALRTSEARLDRILAVAPVGIYVTQGGIIRSANPAFCAMLGYAEDELIDRDEQLLHRSEETSVGIRDEVDRAIAAAGIAQLTVTMRHRRGSLRHVHLQAASPGSDDGRDPLITLVALDLTDQLRFQAERDQTRTALYLAQKMDAIGRLAAGIAHEINTPSQFVVDNITFLRDAMADLQRLLGAERALRSSPGINALPLAEAAAAIEAEIDTAYLFAEIPRCIGQSIEGMERIRGIVVAMREFSHPATETKSAVDLNHVIESTLTITRNEWKYVATVALALAADLPPVPCMPGEMSQVLLNLIVNASQAIAGARTSDGDGLGVITIATALDGGWAELRVSDTGGGIPVGIQDRIFEPFFTTKGIGEGTGQGLALAWAVVVDKHGGTLAFESSPGTGTTFIIRLPMQAAAPDASGSAAIRGDPPEPPRSGPKRGPP